MLTGDEKLSIYYRVFSRTRALEVSPVIAHELKHLASKLYPVSGASVAEALDVNGLRFYVDLADGIGRAFFYGFEPEVPDLHIFESLCQPGMNVWDIGANFGLYALKAARLVGQVGHITAFEPNRRAYDLLEQNISHNGFSDRVTAKQVAISSQNSTVLFYETEQSEFSGLQDTKRARVSSTYQVESVCIDAVWQNLGKPKVDIIKCDIEGGEAAALDGARGLCSAHKDILLQVEVSPKNIDVAGQTKLSAVLSDLANMGFVAWQVDQDVRKLKFVGNVGRSLDQVKPGNLILVRDGATFGVTLKRISESLSGEPWLPKLTSFENDILNILYDYINKCEELRAQQVGYKKTIEALEAALKNKNH